MLHARLVCPTAVLQWAVVRLRPLTEAECYARCYGGRRGEAAGVFLVVPLPGAAPSGARAVRPDGLADPLATTDSGEGREAA